MEVEPAVSADIEIDLTDWYNICLDRPEVFSLVYFKHIIRKPSSKFHFLLYSLIKKINRTEYSNYIAVAAPRGNAKTQIMSVVLPIWCASLEQKKFIILISETSGVAEANLESIKHELTTNEKLANDFPHVVGEGPVWRKEMIRTNNGIQIIALGSGKQIRGRVMQEGIRPDLALLDDMISDVFVRTKGQREFLKEWFTKAVLGMSGPGDKMDTIVVGTILNPNDLLSELLDPNKSPGWEGHRFKAVYQFSKSPLWREWEQIYINRENPNSREDSLKFFNQNKQEMLDGTKVLWPEGDSYYSLMEYKITHGARAFACFTGNTNVLTKEFQHKHINDIKVMDDILSHDGSIQKVTYVNSRLTISNIYSIKIAGVAEKIEATEEHPFLVWSKIKYKHHVLSHQHLYKDRRAFNTDKRKGTVVNRILNNKLVWKFAKDLEVGDTVIQPIPKQEIKDHRCDRDWWWLVGYYLAEGYVNYRTNTIGFSSHLKEVPYLEQVILICKKLGYGITHTIRKGNKLGDKVATLTLTSKELAAELKVFGRYSYGKFLPSFVDSICQKCFSSLWDGYICGDGYNIRSYKGVNSTSKDLLLGFQKNWLKFGVITYMYKMKDSGKTEFRGKVYNTHPLWSLQKIEGKNFRQVWIHEKLLYSKIQSIEKMNVSKPTLVYGISVTGNHTYCIPGAVVKNSEKQSDPIDPSTTLFDNSKIVYYNRQQLIMEDLTIFGALDASSGQARKHGDLASVTTIGKHRKTGIIYVLDSWAKEAPPTDCISYMKQMHKLYRYTRFAVDSDSLKLLKSNIEHEIPDLKLTMYNLRIQKNKRFEKLEPLISNGTIQLLKVHTELLTEIDTYPKSEYDDALDSLEMAVTMSSNRSYQLRTY